ncbi:MAG: type IV pilus modification protein PilV [Gammaproteobacteria bacterium]|nr:type IV pilus modification protein PilV [Gammaproteobacteria bacterium]
MKHTVLHRNRVTPGGHESPSRTDGFSLLESLIALVVFSIGFLALTLLMQTSLKNTNSAFYRSVATEQAYDMADRIRANRGDNGDNVVNYRNAEATADDPGCIANADGCSPEVVADYDGWQWNRTNAQVLPSGGGRIVVNPADPVTGAVSVSVTVSWDDNRTGNDCSAVPAPAPPACVSFEVDFIP